MKRTPLRRRTPLARAPFNRSPVDARVRRATPAWSDLDAIAEIRRECRELREVSGEPHELDHIIPLNHRDVCGLHVPANCRAIPAWLNRRKGNTWSIE